MQYNNSQMVTRIFLLGFQNLQGFRIVFSFFLLIMFFMTICGNLLIIAVVSSSRSLHSPMYFFFTQLSFSDIFLSTTIIPNMLHILLYEGSFVSFIGCLTQFYLFSASESLQCLLLAVMSYDRYQAICNPLLYSSIMDLTFCMKALLLCWVMIFAMILTISVTMSRLWFCGPNIIDHFFCDFDPILELSCSDTSLIKTESRILVIPLAVSPLTVIMTSYVYIIFTILKIRSVTGRKKTFSTCSSHLAVVSMYYGSTISIYLFPSRKNVMKILSLFYTVITPLLNPIIYSLSNREIKQMLIKTLANLSTVFQNGWLLHRSH